MAVVEPPSGLRVSIGGDDPGGNVLSFKFYPLYLPRCLRLGHPDPHPFFSRRVFCLLVHEIFAVLAALGAGFSLNLYAERAAGFDPERNG